MLGRQDFFARVRTKSPGHTTGQLYAAYEAYLTCPISPFSEGRELLAVDCSRCGNCCRRPWRVEVHLPDVLRWASEGRHDILASLERRPRKQYAGQDGASPVISQLAALLAGEDEGRLATTLAIVYSVEGSEGCYVLPKKGGCQFLIDGVITACSIYDTRPEICRLFPDIQ